MSILNKMNVMLGTNKKYIVIATICVTLLSGCTPQGNGANTEHNTETENNNVSGTVNGQTYVPNSEFGVEDDINKKIDDLLIRYYAAYVNADIASLEKITVPLTEMEKSYITAMSQYYEEYRNIECYVKNGISEDSYIVSASFDMKFYEQEVLAPSMNLFYIETNDNGELYINNLYSDFNLTYSEVAVDKYIFDALKTYAMQDDYIALSNKVHTQFDTLIKENQDIYQLTKRTIPAARQQWEDTVYYAQSSETEDTQNQGTEGTENTQNTEVTPPTEDTTSSEQNTQTSESESQAESQQPSESESESEIESQSQPAVPKKVKATTEINIRSGPSTDTDICDNGLPGMEYDVVGIEGEWTKVKLSHGRTGYIMSIYVEPIS